MIPEPSLIPTPSMNGRRRRAWSAAALLTWAIGLGLLFLTVREISPAAAWSALNRLGAWQVVAIAALNVLIWLMMAARWRDILNALGARYRLWQVLMLRLIGFGISFATPGPQIGGEPVQVHLLMRNGTPTATAISSVFLDRTVELMANFTFLIGGLAVMALNGMAQTALEVWLAVGLIWALPFVHLGLLMRGSRPFGRVLGRWSNPLLIKLIEAEAQLGGLCHSNPRVVARAAAWSVLIWILMVGEYALTVILLGAPAQAAAILTALTAARLALLLPIPGGLGALEASQLLAGQSFGWTGGLAAALLVVIRTRDVIVAGVGIGLATYAYRHALFGLQAERERVLQKGANDDA